MSADDRVAATLAAIRERWSKVAYVGLKPEVVPEPGHQPPWLPDVPRLLAAVEAALKLHKPVDRGRVMRCCEGCEAIDGEFHPGFCHEWPCPTVEAITAALTGTQPSEDENHG